MPPTPGKNGGKALSTRKKLFGGSRLTRFEVASMGRTQGPTRMTPSGPTSIRPPRMNLGGARVKLGDVRTKLPCTRTHLWCPRTRLVGSPTRLGATRTNLGCTRTKLRRVRPKLPSVRQRPRDLRVKLGRVRKNFPGSTTRLRMTRVHLLGARLRLLRCQDQRSDGARSAATIQLDRSCLLDLLPHILRRSLVPGLVLARASLTPRLAEASASQSLPSQLNRYGSGL